MGQMIMIGSMIIKFFWLQLKFNFALKSSLFNYKVSIFYIDKQINTLVLSVSKIFYIINKEKY